MAKVEILPAPEWPAGDVRVVADGHDVSMALRAVDVRFEAGHLPKVVLDLAAIDVTPLAAEDAQLCIGKEVRDALLAMGWTPPEET